MGLDDVAEISLPSLGMIQCKTHQLFRFQENMSSELLEKDLHKAPGGLRVCVYAKSRRML